MYLGLDDPNGVATAQVDVVSDNTWRWATSPSTYTLTAGNHMIYIWHREGGARVDKLGITTSVAPPP